MISKTDVILKARQLLLLKMKELQAAVSEISESMTSETKSSAGDKHETARAKMQFEHEKLFKQQSELDDQLADLAKIDPLIQSENIFTGSLIQTNLGYFFIAIALGRIEVGNISVFVISPGSPIGKLFMGLRVHDEFNLNGQQYKILNVY